MNLRFALVLVMSITALPLNASAQWGRGSSGYSGITVYEDPDFRGDSVTFRNEVPDLREHGLNDRISSLEVDGNHVWEVCRDVNFGGGCRVFQGSIEDLRAEGWNDRISSMRAVGFGRNANTNRGGISGNRRGNGNYRGSRLVLYNRTNFRGDARDIVNGSTNLGSTGDRARSVQVYGGTWELCDGSSRNSHCVTVTDNVPDLSRLGLRHGIVSAREIGTQGRNSWWR